MKPTRRDLQAAIISVERHGLHYERSGGMGALPLTSAIGVLLDAEDGSRSDRVALAKARLGGSGASILQGKPTATRACSIVPEPVVPKFDAASQSMTFTTATTVNRPLSEVRRVLDPRAWGQCSDFFDPELTYRLKVEGSHPVRDRRGRWQREDGPEKLGEAWKGMLLERFDGPGVSVDNVLAIDFAVEKTTAIVHYGLYLSDRCRLGGLTDAGGLLKNSGAVTATEENGSTRVTVTKELRFHDYTPGDSGEWIDFGDALSMLLGVMGVVLVDDKFVLKLCCNPVELGAPAS